MKSATTDEGKGKCIFLLSEAGIDSRGRDTNNGRGREREGEREAGFETARAERRGVEACRR